MSIPRHWLLAILWILASSPVATGRTDRADGVARNFVESLRTGKAGRARFESLTTALEPAQIPALLGELNDPDPKVRAGLLYGLICISNKFPTVETGTDLGMDKERDRSQKPTDTRAQGLRLRTQAARAIAPFLTDVAPAVRWHAAIALGAFHAEANTVVPLLVRMLETERGWLHVDSHVLAPASVRSKTDDISYPLGANVHGWEHVRIAPIQALGDFGAESVAALPSLIRILRDDRDPRVRWYTAGAIAGLGPKARPAVPALLGALRSTEVAFGEPVEHGDRSEAVDDCPLRLVAATALGAIGPDAEAAVPELIRALADPDPRVCGEAATALGAIGPPAAGAVTPLASLAAQDRKDSISDRAAEALAAIGRGSVPALGAMVFDACADTRFRAISAIGDIGPNAAAAIPDLVKALADPVDEVREAAAEALGKIGNVPGVTAAVDGLIAALHDPECTVRTEAAESLGRMGPLTDRVIPALARAIKDIQPGYAALDALEQMGMPAFPAILTLLQDSSADTRNLAVRALGRLARLRSENPAENEPPAKARERVQAVRAALIEACAEPDERLRFDAARALSLGDDNILFDMVADLAAKSPSIRLRSIRTLGYMGSEAVAALVPLLECLHDPDAAVRDAARAAITDIEKSEP
jgi:HEAT repeat protein